MAGYRVNLCTSVNYIHIIRIQERSFLQGSFTNTNISLKKKINTLLNSAFVRQYGWFKFADSDKQIVLY